MHITVFGGAKPAPGEAPYTEAQQLGAMLAQNGHTVITGGYMGVMEAVSRGAAEAGGHVIGITCQEIEDWRKTRANAWVKEERKAATLQERLGWLIDACDAAIALPGGPGTLAEISLMWNRMIIQSIPLKPLILVGEGWQEVMGAFTRTLGYYVSEKDRPMIQYAATTEEACRMLSHR